MIYKTPSPHTYSKHSFSWGDLRVLRKGLAYCCVIHPEHLAAINRGEDFICEQGYRWRVGVDDAIVTLRHGNDVFTISLAELNA